MIGYNAFQLFLDKQTFAIFHLCSANTHESCQTFHLPQQLEKQFIHFEVRKDADRHVDDQAFLPFVDEFENFLKEGNEKISHLIDAMRLVLFLLENNESLVNDLENLNPLVITYHMSKVEYF